MHFGISILLIHFVVAVFSMNVLHLNEQRSQILLKQLRRAVEKNVTKSYETEDAFLIRFLRASEFDVQRASEMILKNMKWRSDNNIDDIGKVVNPVDKEFKFTSGSDRIGRPTILVKSTEVETRKMLLTGNRELCLRMFMKVVENLFRASLISNFSQVVLIFDLHGFSVRKHACPDCVKLATELIQTAEDNYPELLAAFFFINTPRLFEVIFKVLKSTMAAHTRRVLRVYGYDQQEWSEALLEWISIEQLYKFFGHHHKLRHEKHISSSASRKILKTSKLSDFDGKILWQTRTEATSNIGRIQTYTNIVLILSFMLPKLF